MAKSEYFRGTTGIGGKTIAWESAFPVGLRYGCERCGICCMSRVDLWPKDVDLLEQNGLGSHIVYPNTTVNSSILRPHLSFNGDFCSFTKGTSCSIYKLRPLICRAYPIQVAAGFENDLVIDIILKCPYVGLGSEPEIRKADIEDRIADYKANLPNTIANTLAHRKTLADHIRVAYAPAFLLRARKLEFMDSAIRELEGLESPVDMIGTLRAWADGISAASHEVFVREHGGVLGGNEQERQVLSRMPKAYSGQSGEFSKARWKNAFKDLGSHLFLPVGHEIRRVPVKLGWGASIDGKRHRWGSLAGLAYSNAALRELTDYMRLAVRRPNFQLTVAQLAEYMVDYKRMAIVDYALEAAILSNAMMVYLDPISRAAAAFNGHSEIERSDLRAGISNIDAQFLSSLSKGMLTMEFTKLIDRAFPTAGTDAKISP